MNSTLLKLYDQACGNLTAALSLYNSMNYDNAMSCGKTALDLFTLFVAGTKQQSQKATPAQEATMIIIVAAAGGLIGGMAIALFIKVKGEGK